MARVHGWTRKPPRVWAQAEDSIEVWLQDQAWIIRVAVLPGTDDGTPNSRTDELGPYAARLWAPVRREQFQGDRERLDVTHSLVIASDIAPQERDKMRVRTAGGEEVVLRIEGTVNARPSGWQTSIWQMEANRVENY